ncbi:head decoration protein [Methylobacterium gregans]|uniref:Head decoration protein n=1 Tax=Methylobacterium gregans TaxID=374424 RepID=A0AA37HNF9_9HYPH|nr:head decoration protein [Methylobacterium gregans]MDQ0521959.1 hypothetical protein [Methylobacterium gregans]GJD78007.1 hypothetical protein NBEOAGPD_1219 [Methylobacterium gregans]GLS51976.1 hypothetical protein GCM10007886_01580 [Methylobacterium gregans]
MPSTSLLATEPKRLSDLLRYHVPAYSLDQGSLAASAAALEFGTPLALAADASGAFVPWVPGASDSTGTVVALSGSQSAVKAAAQPILVIARHATVVASAIEWPAGANPTQKTAALAALATRGLIARQGA